MRALVAAVLALLVATAVASSFLFVEPKLDRAVKQALQKNENTIPVYVRFPSLDLSVYEAIENVDERARFLVNDLQVHAELSQASIVAKLTKDKIEHKTLWIANGLAIKNCPVELVNWLATHPNVELVTLDEEVQMIFEKPTQVGAVPPQDDYEWSLEWIQGTKVWADGHEGEGVVVGVIDTGASYTHEAIGDRYRGKNADGTFDHDYNWFQTIGSKSPTPIDDHSHGTHCTGTILGKSKTHTYGMAPKAQFMSCKAFTSGGSGSKSSIMDCLQFMLAPTTVDGQEPDTSKRPHVISNSYTCGSCLGDGKKAVDALVAAGVSVVAAAGNGGPGCSSISAEPGILDAVISVGALEVKKDNVTSFSSRGPIRTDGSNRIKPDVTAPGRDILSSVPGNNYGRMSGTSMACPHVAGSVALAWSAVPELKRKPKETQEVIRKYAKHIDVSGTYCNSKGIPNNMYGWGTTQIHDSINGAKKLLRK